MAFPPIGQNCCVGCFFIGHGVLAVFSRSERCFPARGAGKRSLTHSIDTDARSSDISFLDKALDARTSIVGGYSSIADISGGFGFTRSSRVPARRG